MENRLDKIQQRKEKIQLSCSSRLTNLLDFRNGGRNLKLLRNGNGRSPNCKNVTDAGNLRNNCSFDMQVQNLMMKTQNSAKKCSHSDMEQKKSIGFRLFKQFQINDKKAIKKTHQNSNCCSEDEYIQGHQRSLSATVSSSEKPIIDKMSEEVCCQIYREDNEEDIDVFLKLLQRDQERTKLCLEHKSSEFRTSNVSDYEDIETTTKTKKKDMNNSSTKAKYINEFSPRSMASKRIVILKPKSKVKQKSENVSCHCSYLQSKYISKNKGQVKEATFSAFEDIKRKFRQPVGTNHKKPKSFLDRNLNGLIHDKQSLEKGTPVDSFTETFDKKINTLEQQELDLFLEAKRHLSERLKTVDLGESLPGKETPRTLKTILSSCDLKMNSTSSLQKQVLELRPKIIDNLIDGTFELENINSQLLDESKKSHEYSECMERIYPGHANNFSHGNSLNSSLLDICKLQILENIEEKDEYRSPVSVLEPFCFEEFDSPPTESKFQPRCLNFKDHEIETRTSINEEDEDHLSVYIRSVIHVSGLSFVEFSSEEVKPITTEVDCDVRLLLDCAHEVISQVYRFNFGCSPWTLPPRRKLKPVPHKENFIDEVLKEVNRCVRQKNGEPSLDQLVKKDFACSRSWLDLHECADDIVKQLAEDVLQDAIFDTIHMRAI